MKKSNYSCTFQGRIKGTKGATRYHDVEVVAKANNRESARQALEGRFTNISQLTIKEK